MLWLQEIKTIGILEVRCYSMWRDSNVGWLHNEGINGAGSTLIMWHKEAFCCDSHVKGRGFIDIYGQHIKSKRKCVVVNVYVECNLNKKIALWEECQVLEV